MCHLDKKEIENKIQLVKNKKYTQKRLIKPKLNYIFNLGFII